ncbi:MAG TPA: hypothetical protein VMT11_21540 [Myxococcaceae bacterium]|nr:hypothetical protein [Myxococcaceae bacterium]
MRHSLLLGLTGLTLLLAPARAEAQWSARLALEAPLWAGHSTGSLGHGSEFTIAQSFQPALDAIGSYFVTDSVGVDLEFRIGIAATGMFAERQRMTLGPGVTFDWRSFPLYGRVSFPVQIEDVAVLYLRLGGGLKITDLGFFRVYFELTVDAALVGNGVSPLGSVAVNAALGVWFRL